MMYRCLKLCSCWSCPSESYDVGRVAKCADLTGWRRIVTNLHVSGRSLILTSLSCLHWQRQMLVETSVAEQPCSGRALLTYLLWEGARKGELNIACQLKSGQHLELTAVRSRRNKNMRMNSKTYAKMCYKLNIACWNIRTLLDIDKSRRPERRTALVTRELERLTIDIAALSETRLPEENHLI